MKYMDRPLKYIGQTGRTFYTRYKEHIEVIRNSISNSGYSNHILSTGHVYGCITVTMEITKTEKKRKHLNTLEKYNLSRLLRLHMNDTY